MTTIDDVFAEITSENRVSEVIRNVATAIKFDQPVGLEQADALTRAIATYVDETIEPLPEDKHGKWHKSASSNSYISVEPVQASRRNWLAGYQGFIVRVDVSPDHPKYAEAQGVLDHIEQIANHYRD